MNSLGDLSVLHLSQKSDGCMQRWSANVGIVTNCDRFRGLTEC